MKTFEELKKDVVEKKNMAVAFCKEHKEGIKNTAIFAAGVGFSYVFTKDYYTPRVNEETRTNVVRYADRCIGYKTRTFNKHGKERKQIEENVAFNNPRVALRIGRELIQAAHEELGEYGRYIWESEDSREKSSV